MADIPVTLGNSLDTYDGLWFEGPYVRNPSPLKPVCVDGSTATSTFDIVSTLPETLNLPTLVITATFNSTTTETVYTGGAFVAPYATSSTLVPTVTAIQEIYAASVDRDGGWPGNSTIRMDVTGTSLPSALSILHGTWEWCTLPSVAPPVAYTIGTIPDPLSDTIRGGLEVVFFTSPTGVLINTSYDEALTGSSVPSTLTPATSGSGEIRPTEKGVELRLGSSPSSYSVLTTAATMFAHFDLAVDVELLSVPSRALGETVLAELGFGFAPLTGDFVTAGLTMGLGAGEATSIHARGGVTQAGLVPGLTRSIGRSALTGKVTLRIVRHQDHVWAFVGERSTDAASYGGSVYSSLTKLGDWTGFTTGSGLFRLRAAQDVSAGAVARFSNLTVRSHATIDEQLLVTKADLSTDRLSGNVPATSLARRGLRDIVIFGLFGEAVGVDQFEYTLPSPKTSGRRGRATTTDTLRTFSDAALRDPTEWPPE